MALSWVPPCPEPAAPRWDLAFRPALRGLEHPTGPAVTRSAALGLSLARCPSVSPSLSVSVSLLDEAGHACFKYLLLSKQHVHV